MRLPSAAFLALVVAGALAGCTAPDEGDEADPLFGLCPQWMQGGGGQTIGLALSGNETASRELGPANETLQGKPLDMYRLRFDGLAVDGRVELRAKSADGRQLAIRDYRPETPQIVPVLIFDDGSAAGKEFDVFLSPVTHDAPAAAAPATLEWTQTEGESEFEVSVTYHYKVCGSA